MNLDSTASSLVIVVWYPFILAHCIVHIMAIESYEILGIIQSLISIMKLKLPSLKVLKNCMDAIIQENCDTNNFASKGTFF